MARLGGVPNGANFKYIPLDVSSVRMVLGLNTEFVGVHAVYANGRTPVSSTFYLYDYDLGTLKSDQEMIVIRVHSEKIQKKVLVRYTCK